MLKFLRILSLTILVLLSMASIAGLVLWKTSGLRFYSVQTSSMSPVLQPSDLLITTKPANLQPGDIISYRSSNNTEQIVSHRIVQAYPGKGYVITRGDNLNYPDPPVAYSSVTGKAIKSVPELGYLVDLIHKPLGLISLVYLPALAIAAYELSRLISHISYRSYGLAEPAVAKNTSFK
jgi:signal peptidase I